MSLDKLPHSLRLSSLIHDLGVNNSLSLNLPYNIVPIISNTMYCILTFLLRVDLMLSALNNQNQNLKINFKKPHKTQLNKKHSKLF